MHTVQLKIQDSIYGHIMFLLNSLDGDKLKIVEDQIVVPDTILSSNNEWSEEELKNIGKIGLDSKSFVEDSEDYSKW